MVQRLPRRSTAIRRWPQAANSVRRDVAAFEGAARTGEDLLIACTQEAPLFRELHAQFKCTGDVRFANIRESAGWGEEGRRATAKTAALLAVADLPAPQAVPAVSYHSQGRLLIVGDAAAALHWRTSLPINCRSLFDHA
jgi:hypothetical protein